MRPTILPLLAFMSTAPPVLAQSPLWNNACHPDQRETYAVAFDNTGATVISASECDNAHVRLWNASDGALLWDGTVGSPLMCLVGAQFSASGTYFAVMEELGNLLIYDRSGGTPVLLHTIDLGVNASYSLAFSPDNTKLVADGSGGVLRVYDVAAGTLLQTIPGNNGTVFTVAWSPSGDLIAAGSSDNKVRLWNAADGTLAGTLTGHSADIRSVRFNTAGDHLVTAAANGEVKLWMYMMNMWMEHASFTVPENLHQVDISDDDAYILVGGSSTTHLYEAMSGEPIGTFNVQGGGDVWSVDFEPGGHNAVTGTSSGRVVYWALEGTIGIHEHGTISFDVHPNPTADQVVITVPDELRGGQAELFTTSGSQVLVTRLNGATTPLDLRSLPAGDYLLRVRIHDRIGIHSIFKR